MNELWESAREILQDTLTEQNLKTWIEPLKPLRLEDKIIILGCPNRFFLNWVRDNYQSKLLEAFMKIQNNGLSIKNIKLELAPAGQYPPKNIKKRPQPRQRQYELPGIDVYKRAPLRFNRRFTFDRFVVGHGNHFAYSASLALAMDQELNTDSLYLLSAPGLGKSHLSQAIGHRILAKAPQTNVFYLTAEDFTNEMVYSIKNNCIDDFKNKYRQRCDVLVLEEVSFLSGKEKVQTELSYTLDYLQEGKKKIIFTSSSLPKDIPRLRRNLASRLNSGLISTIEPPDYETRLNILKAKAKDQELALSEDVLSFMAQHLTQDVRQLECCLYSLGAQSKLLSRKIDLNMAKEVLGGLVKEQLSVDPDDILRLVCRCFSVTLDHLRSRSRRQDAVMPRNVSMYLCRELTDLSLQAIGKIFNRNHATVLYALTSLEQKLDRDHKLKNQVEFLSGQLRKTPPWNA